MITACLLGAGLRPRTARLAGGWGSSSHAGGMQSAVSHNAAPDWGHGASGCKRTPAQLMPAMPRPRRLRARPIAPRAAAWREVTGVNRPPPPL